MNLGGCNDCHSPKVFAEAGSVPDATRLLSGSPGSAPLPKMPAGVIGPDLMGRAHYERYDRVGGPVGREFRGESHARPDPPQGVDGRHLHPGHAYRQAHGHGPIDPTPAMPWPSLAKLPDEDLWSCPASVDG